MNEEATVEHPSTRLLTALQRLFEQKVHSGYKHNVAMAITEG